MRFCKIYLKKLGNNGQSEFLCYLVEETQTADPIKEINARLINIENSLGALKHDKSVSSTSNVQQSTGHDSTAVAEQNESNDEAESTGFPKNARNDKWKKLSRFETDCYKPCK